MTNENHPAPETDTWNELETIERLGGDEELLRELIGIFVTESPKLLAKLRDAIGSSDAEAMMRGAHSIKGELSCLGAVAAANTAQKLEHMGSNKEMAGALETFSNLEREVQAFKLAFGERKGADS